MFHRSEAFWSGQVATRKLELIYLQNSFEFLAYEKPQWIFFDFCVVV